MSLSAHQEMRLASPQGRAICYPFRWQKNLGLQQDDKFGLTPSFWDKPPLPPKGEIPKILMNPADESYTGRFLGHLIGQKIVLPYEEANIISESAVCIS